MNKPTEETLINYYFHGYYLSQDNVKFPNWFEFYSEKMSCLEGYNDASLQTVKDNEELNIFVKKLLD